MMSPLLICTDLDRTLIPNGPQPESPGARAQFQRLAQHPDVTLAYVSGRHRELIEQAILDYDLPTPDYAIADVGSTIYRIDAAGWVQCEQWDTLIAPDWGDWTHATLLDALRRFSALQPQAPARQNRHKLSFHVTLTAEPQVLIDQIAEHLRQAGVKANLIWSIDPLAGVGLLDILPASANKLHAIHFVRQQAGFAQSQMVFAGDSGNDLDVLLSGIPAILVANADADIRHLIEQSPHANVYLARGGYLGMNGNYSAGILEGIAYFQPAVAAWLRQQPGLRHD